MFIPGIFQTWVDQTSTVKPDLGFVQDQLVHDRIGQVLVHLDRAAHYPHCAYLPGVREDRHLGAAVVEFEVVRRDLAQFREDARHVRDPDRRLDLDLQLSLADARDGELLVVVGLALFYWFELVIKVY